jgi:polyhydroxyalkanoate synthesis regulator phasin
MSKKAKATLVDAEGASITVEPAPKSGFELPIPDVPLSAVVDVARMGVQLGIGLVALAYENAYRITFDAIDRGAKIEKKSLTALGEFEREQVTYMKDYLQRVKSKAQPSGSSIEAHVEEALKTHDVPTRDDIRELREQIAALGSKIK